MGVQTEAQIVPITLVTHFWYIFVDQMETGQKQEESGDLLISMSAGCLEEVQLGAKALKW